MFRWHACLCVVPEALLSVCLSGGGPLVGVLVVVVYLFGSVCVCVCVCACACVS